MPKVTEEKIHAKGTLIKKKHGKPASETGEVSFYRMDGIQSLEKEIDHKLGDHIEYYVIFGKRSNGKSYAVWEYMLDDYVNNGYQGVYMRRWDDELVRSKGLKAPLSLCCNGYGVNRVAEVSNGQWDTIVYKDRMFYLAKTNEKNPTAPPAVDHTPFCFSMAISTMQKDKSTGGYQNVRTVLFDEFIPENSRYVSDDEFVTFQHCISTIIRTTNDQARIYMCANAFSPRCLYFYEMGLKFVNQMVPGDLQLYQYGDSGLYVAVEYADSPVRHKPTDKFFAFGNPKLDIIAGDGTWATATYPKAPRKFTKDECVFSCFVEYEGELAQGDIIVSDDCTFIFWHMKSTMLKDPDYDLIYSQTIDPRPNWKRNLRDRSCETTDAIFRLINDGRSYYADNMVGDLISQAYMNMV